MALNIREAYHSDVAAMYYISLHSHQQNYGQLIPPSGRARFNARYSDTYNNKMTYKRIMSGRISDGAHIIYIAEYNGSVAGYTVIHRVSLNLYSKKGLFVDPKMTRLGAGSALVEASLGLLSDGQKMQLSVISNNEIAKRLYMRYGYKKLKNSDKTFFGAKLEVMQYQSIDKNIT